MRPSRSLVVALALLTLVACRTSASEPDEATRTGVTQSAPAPSVNHPLFVPAPAGDVSPIVLSEMARAQADGRRLVVYEGAPWCEPCKHFHAAVASGELDKAFPKLTLLEFDADRDGARLATAGYNSQYIPLFALPGKDGRAAGPKAAGGIKGDGVVTYLTKKLEQLLAQGS
jgi:thiol-disulfide isomerase/thioredoxin